jgi:hypothetical protein
MWSVAVYNTLANSLLMRAVSALYNTIRLDGRVLFVGDPQTHSGAQLHRANYLLNGDLGGLTNLQYGNITYHHHKRPTSAIVKTKGLHFDLVVVCVESVQHLHYESFQNIAYATMGTTNLNTRPDFFTYPLPPLGNFGQAVQFLMDVTTAAYLIRSTPTLSLKTR